jgi:hypothetical protein
MRNPVLTLFILSLLAVMPSAPRPVAAAPFGDPKVEFDSDALLNEFLYGSEFKPCPRGTYRVSRHTKTKKKLVNALIAGGVGAAIGGGIGGGRGALIGAGAGSGGYLTYRYVRDKRGRCVPRYVRG